jgi:hypothetical protein
VGRVCGTESCDDSDVIAGIEWAGGQHAKVANLSLADTGSDGTDLVSMAINAVTAASGTLFVCAAGNEGTPRSVGAPTAADAAVAVAVGSVGADDTLSYFSSTGPRRTDGALKPDLTAPGEYIVSARAAGTELGEPVGDAYVILSGTSMATPHVTGAAAILAQQHPDWTAAQLKAALMSTAKPTPDTSPYAQGAGRVDVARAVTQTVRADSGSVYFGLIHWPTTAAKPVTKSVTYRNDGAAPVTLALSVTSTAPDGSAGPAGLFATGVATVTVPAHGSAGVPVTENPRQIDTTPVGSYAGRLVASTVDGKVLVQTTLGVSTEPESYDVTITTYDRLGKAPSAAIAQSVSLLQLDLGTALADPPTIDPSRITRTVRVPRGTYAAIGLILTEDPDRNTPAGRSRRYPGSSSTTRGSP